MKAVLTKNGVDYIVTVYNGTRFVESTIYPYVPREIAKKAAVQRLKHIGVDVTGMTMVKTSENTWESVKA